ncbi:MAG: class II aldolase/adducin family protein [Candidatus Bathyarchaeia archaeon]
MGGKSTEKYVGVKFKTEFLLKHPPKDERVKELAEWCRIFHLHGLTPVVKGRSMGNLSFRVKKGSNKFIITSSGLGPKNMLNPECFVKVVNCDLERMVVYVYGVRKPSSESLLHHRIYALRCDVNAVFHGHDLEITENAEMIGAAETKEWKPYGSLELVKSVEQVLNGNNFIVMKKHGFISLGSSMDDAGRLALAKRSQLKNRQMKNL